jgi:hypothetical protein
VNRFVRVITAAAVLAVASIAGVVSFSHIYDLGLTHGQSGVAARLLPLSVDGMLLACGLVLLHEARAGRPAIWQARLGLWSGIAATVTANVLYGVHYGALGAVLSGWPAYALIIAAETMMAQIRRYGAPVPVPLVAAPADDVDEGQGDEPADEPAAVPVVDEPPAIVPAPAPAAITAPVPTSAEHAAELAVRATHAAGNVLSARAVERQFYLTRNTATKLHRRVLKELIGGQEPELDEAQRRVRAWDESKRVNDADETTADPAPDLTPA